jgi:hypothetical protein
VLIAGRIYEGGVAAIFTMDCVPKTYAIRYILFEASTQQGKLHTLGSGVCLVDVIVSRLPGQDVAWAIDWNVACSKMNSIEVLFLSGYVCIYILHSGFTKVKIRQS